jgi:CubicO group peptidase (beta-lactamase class C family)
VFLRRIHAIAHKHLLSLLSIGILWPQCQLATGQTADGDLERRLDSASQQILRHEPSAGLSVLVARHGRVLFEKGYGMASLELKVPATPETVYHLVGVGDQFTCIAIMQLVEQGKLSLDQDIAGLVPDFPTQGRHITVKDLLAHTSGVPDYHYLGDLYMSTQGQPRAFDQVNEMFAGRPLKNEPGHEFDWNVSDFHLMAQIIEHVSHENYGQYMLEHIYGPAGATQTVYWDDGTIVPGLASTYRLFGNGYAPELMDVMAAGGGFRFCSSVHDLFRVLLALEAASGWVPGPAKSPATWASTA